MLFLQKMDTTLLHHTQYTYRLQQKLDLLTLPQHKHPTSKYTKRIPSSTNTTYNSNNYKLTISSTEAHFTRLGCSHHPTLNSYKHCLSNTHTDLYPLCQASPRIIKDLTEECPNLAALRQQHNIPQIQQLWSEPVSVVAYLHGAD